MPRAFVSCRSPAPSGRIAKSCCPDGLAPMGSQLAANSTVPVIRSRKSSEMTHPVSRGRTRWAPLPEVCARDTCAPMIDLYYWPTPNGWKISIMLEECSLPYTLKPVNIGRGEQFSPAFLRLSPNNRMPAIVDHDPPGGGDPLAIFESAAILQYLAEKAGRFMPRDVRGKYEVLQWVAWQVANLGPVAGQLNHFANYATE